jgi:hypothetical protein
MEKTSSQIAFDNMTDQEKVEWQGRHYELAYRRWYKLKNALFAAGVKSEDPKMMKVTRELYYCLGFMSGIRRAQVWLG